jgi:hypothetical protein
VIGSVLAAVLVIGLGAWQANALFGGDSGSDSGDSHSYASPYSSPYSSPDASPYDTPTSPAESPVESPDEETTPVESPDDETVPSSPAATVTGLSGQWNGSYVCNQGITGLVLTIEDHGDGTVNAVFAFYPAPSNPQVPRGSFAMAGTLQSGVLTLRATYWIDQPPNYLAVNLQGTADPSTPNHLDGRVYGPNCTTFSVDRS